MDRSIQTPLLSLSSFERITSKISSYSKSLGQPVLIELLFGDILSLPFDLQSEYYEVLSRQGVNIGFTGNFADKSLSKHYASCLSSISTTYGQSGVFNITIDPFRLNSDWYVHNLVSALSFSHHFREFHSQILLSTTLLRKLPPEELDRLITSKLGTDINVALVAAPPSNGELNSRYQYDFIEAELYVRTFYELSDTRKQFLKSEVARFNDTGLLDTLEPNNSDVFSETIFTHLFIDSKGEVSPIIEAAYGDVLLGSRFGPGVVFGNINHCLNLNDILTSPLVSKSVKRNRVKMANSKFSCPSCEFYTNCSNKGIGLARESYRSWSSRNQSCLGIKGLV
jgi:hypothetical protein